MEIIGKSLPNVGTNTCSRAMPYCEAMVAIYPILAELIAAELPNIEDVQESLWHYAPVAADHLQAPDGAQLEAQGSCAPMPWSVMKHGVCLPLILTRISCSNCSC
jgi:hypothetical protein